MKTKKLASIVATIAILGVTALAPPQVFADDTICGNDDIPLDIRAASGCPESQVGELPTVIKNILIAIIGISGLVAVIYIIVGGIQYMTSSGDANKAEKARKTIFYALVGLVICALAFAIVSFTIDNIIQ